MILKCKRCDSEFEDKRKDKKYCESCRKKVDVEITMKCRKKKHPEVEVGVGSGNNSRNHGVTHPSYTTGIAAYRKMIDTKRWAICGSKEHLLVHHIDENRLHNEPSNLVCWCKKCHQQHHTKRDPKTGRYLAK